MTELEKTPFVRAFTIAILRTIKRTKFPEEEKKQVINADLIPSISDDVFRRILTEERKVKQETFFMPSPVFQDKTRVKVQERKETRVMPAPKNFAFAPGTFGKLDGLIMDPAVTTIECPGPLENVIITRAGLKQFTKIQLAPAEIKASLEKIAEEARVPLMEGVFRAAIRDFVISAIVSEIIGSRFIIKKYTPYSLLEEKM